MAIEFFTNSVFYAATIYLNGNYSGLAHGSAEIPESYSGNLAHLLDDVVANLRSDLSDQNPHINPDSWTINLTAFNRV